MSNISAEEWQFLSFFEVEPELQEVGIPWSFNDSLYKVQHCDFVLSFAIAPAFYQTKWFIAICIISFLLMIVLIVHLRIQLTANRLRALFEERLDERARVAQHRPEKELRRGADRLQDRVRVFHAR